jgi:hypothetical protein
MSKYAGTAFSGRQTWQIYLGLESGLDISSYAIPGFSWKRMRDIRQGLEEGIQLCQV